MEEIVGKIHSIESLATLDGDGVRYGVFLVDCPLRCVYCHNPDTWANPTACQPISARRLADKVLRYKPYFKNGGGVTFSGGEPLLQADFIAQCGQYLNEMGIGYCLDTCGCVELTESVKNAVQGAELIILDIKMYDKASYQKYVKGDLDKVLAFGDYCNSLGKRMWLRTVIIPHINDFEQAIDKYADLTACWTNIEKYELLAFHTMGFDKYKALGIVNQLADTPALDIDKLNTLQDYLNKRRNTNDN